MRTRMAAFGTAMMAAVAAGCAGNPAGMVMSGGKMAYTVIEGAEAKVRPLKDVSTAALKPYRSVRLGQVATDVPALIPASELEIIRTQMARELASEANMKRFPGGGKTLLANVSCRFLKERGTFGGEGRLDMIVTLADSESKDEVGQLFVEGLSKSPLAGKAEHMAKANAGELMDYLFKQQQGKQKG